MQYGVCSLSIVPMRKLPEDAAEMINQIIFGETFEVLEHQKNWSHIRLAHDAYEGWVDNKQIEICTQEFYKSGAKKSLTVSQELVDIISEQETAEFYPIFIGSILPFYAQGGELKIGSRKMSFSGGAATGVKDRNKLVEYAYQYLNAPYLWGGRSPAGIDCSGFVQMVYRLSGFSLPRDSGQQATHGATLSFIEESEPGDLAFFDNEEGKIVHVGIILSNNYIIHASGKVRLDRLDQTGIFNPESGSHTHKLRVIKKII